jgi:hypothetical protein
VTISAGTVVADCKAVLSRISASSESIVCACLGVVAMLLWLSLSELISVNAYSTRVCAVSAEESSRVGNVWMEWGLGHMTRTVRYLRPVPHGYHLPARRMQRLTDLNPLEHLHLRALTPLRNMPTHDLQICSPICHCNKLEGDCCRTSASQDLCLCPQKAIALLHRRLAQRE